MILSTKWKLIGLKWAYKVEKDLNGNVIKHKERLAGEGYVQKPGEDCDEVFSHVA